VIHPAIDPALAPRFAALRAQLVRSFRQLGGFIVPRSYTPAEPGSDLRYAGTLPMRRTPGRGEVDAQGQLHGHDGLYVVDLSIFPAMGAKHPTLTLMANADRIGRAIAAG
jgi:choline dehydrogenase-like flavoprotein